MLRRGHTLIPRGPMDEAALDGFDAGRPVRVRITQPRNVGHFRLYWAALALVRDNLSVDLPLETLHEVVKVKLGYTLTVPMKSGAVTIPGSIAFDAMTEAEFQLYMARFWDWLRSDAIPGINRPAFERAAREMMGETPEPRAA